MDIHTDEADQMLRNQRQTKWYSFPLILFLSWKSLPFVVFFFIFTVFDWRDRKRKKFVQHDNADPKNKKIRTESGAWIPATYKSDLYEQWKKSHQIDYLDQKNRDSDGDDAQPGPVKDLHSANKVLGSGRSKFIIRMALHRSIDRLIGCVIDQLFGRLIHWLKLFLLSGMLFLRWFFFPFAVRYAKTHSQTRQTPRDKRKFKASSSGSSRGRLWRRTQVQGRDGPGPGDAGSPNVPPQGTPIGQFRAEGKECQAGKSERGKK